MTSGELNKFQLWWRLVNLEHGLIFWFTGLVTIILLCLLSYNAAYGNPGLAEGITFLLLEYTAISQSIMPVIGVAFLLVIAITLFATQLTVFEATSRIMAENISLLSKSLFPAKYLGKYFYFFLWLQIMAGIIVLSVGFTEPLALIILAATLNAAAMFVHIGLTVWVNKTLLPKPVQPNYLRVTIMSFAFLFFGAFTIFTFVQKFFG